MDFGIDGRPVLGPIGLGGRWSIRVHPPYEPYFIPPNEFISPPGRVEYNHDCNSGTDDKIIGLGSQFIFSNPGFGEYYIQDPCVCCIGIRGNANCSPDDIPDISDITRLIDYLYLSHDPLCCEEEADANGSGGEPDISDITRLIDYLYLSHDPLATCP